MATWDGVRWGLAVGERCRQPLAAHSMIINDHPAGSKCRPGEKQRQSAVSESECQWQEIRLRAREGGEMVLLRLEMVT